MKFCQKLIYTYAEYSKLCFSLQDIRFEFKLLANHFQPKQILES